MNSLRRLDRRQSTRAWWPDCTLLLASADAQLPFPRVQSASEPAPNLPRHSRLPASASHASAVDFAPGCQSQHHNHGSQLHDATIAFKAPAQLTTTTEAPKRDTCDSPPQRPRTPASTDSAGGRLPVYSRPAEQVDLQLSKPQQQQAAPQGASWQSLVYAPGTTGSTGANVILAAIFLDDFSKQELRERCAEAHTQLFR